jgi:colanic acid/amylovoran biosynthesis glycosyltransferase
VIRAERAREELRRPSAVVGSFVGRSLRAMREATAAVCASRVTQRLNNDRARRLDALVVGDRLHRQQIYTAKLLASSRVHQKVAYVLGNYPKVSQSFIQDEISAVERDGPEIMRIALNRSTGSDLAAAASRAEAERTFYVKAQSPGQIMHTVVHAFAASPVAFARVLWQAVRAGGTDVRRNAWGALYFIEGLLVWDHCRRAVVRRIHAHFAHPVANVAWLAASFGTHVDPKRPWQWSVTIHGPHDFYVEPLLGLEDKARSATAIVCISDYGRAQVLRMIAPQDWPKVVVRRCGIDLDRFPERPPRPLGEPPRILSVGRLVPEKGQSQLVAAVALLARRGVDVRVELIGDGPARAEIQQAALDAGVADRIGLLGELPPSEVAARLAEADAFCLPSFGEGIPISIMEAMAVGVPVVCTAVGGVTELALDGQTGVVVPPGRPDLLAAGIERLLSDEAYRSALVSGARSRVADRHDLQRNVLSLVAVLVADETFEEAVA